jgi:hypothetical protein
MHTKKINSKSKRNVKSTVPAVSKKVKNEVDRFLKSNAGVVEDSAVPFMRSFYASLLSEAEGDEGSAPPESEVQNVPQVSSPEDFTPEKTKNDFENSLNDETPKDEFDIEGISPDVSAESVGQIKEWSAKLDQFAEFLNDPTTESLHKVLSDNDRPGSLLRGITRKASDSITRIAGEIEKLKEVLNSFIIMAPKKLRDTEQLG